MHSYTYFINLDMGSVYALLSEKMDKKILAIEYILDNYDQYYNKYHAC